MLYIDTLSAFVECLLLSGEGGLYFPQNAEYVSTCRLVREAAACHGKRMRFVPGFQWILNALCERVGLIGKVFGTLTYDKDMSKAFADAGQLPFEETIRLTEAGR